MTEPMNTELLMYRMDQQDATLKEILVQVKMTNGRVTELETKDATREGIEAAASTVKDWHIKLVGGWLGLLSIVVAVLALLLH